jgi:hypothetical protein
MYWLKHHHGNYRDRLEVTAKMQKQEELTEEQAAIVKDALRLASLIPEESSQSNNTPIQAFSAYEEPAQQGTTPEAPMRPPSARACGTDDSRP